MKRIITLGILLCAISGMAQTDSTKNQKADTIRVGGITIIRKAGSKERQIVHDRDYKISSRRRVNNSNLSTNWWIFDLGW